MKKIILLGSTGSIGTQTLESCRQLGYGVEVLSANKNTKLLEQQAREFSPSCVVVSDKSAYIDLKQRLSDLPIKVLSGSDGMCEAVQLNTAEIVCNAVVGMVGLAPTLAAIEAKKTIALANKETLVAGGRLVINKATENNVSILPVDSEHSAIFQCLQGNDRSALQKIILTASGGPFRGKTRDELEKVTLDEALNHPNWSMGAKITVDSATMMNKGLECIEAMWLFNLKPEQIEVVVHPQSVVHSAVEYDDGAVIAQLGTPDMMVPIQYALTYPHREKTSVKKLSLTDYGDLTFEKPDTEAFECLKLALDAASRGGLCPCAINAANEQAVALFLNKKITFLQIAQCVRYVLHNLKCKGDEHYTLKDVLETDNEARMAVLEYCRIGIE